MTTKLGLFMHSLQFFEGGLSGHADIIIFFVLLEVTLDYNLSTHPLGGQGNERWKNPYWHPFLSPTHCFPTDQPRQKSLHEPLAPRSVLQTKAMEWYLAWRVELTCFLSSLIIASTMKKTYAGLSEWTRCQHVPFSTLVIFTPQYSARKLEYVDGSTIKFSLNFVSLLLLRTHSRGSIEVHILTFPMLKKAAPVNIHFSKLFWRAPL